MTLDDWMTENNVTADYLATELGVTAAAVRLWRRGLRVPRTNILANIRQVTGLAVQPEDFVKVKAPVA